MEPIIIYVVSDSVGETADLVVRAILGQFDQPVDLRRVSFVHDEETIKDIVQIAKNENAIISYTLVEPILRSCIEEEAKAQNVNIFDIMGPLMNILENQYNLTSRNEPGSVRRLNDDYFKKIEAIEFAVKYDDGRDSKGVLKADIVIMGISRTSKTPLSQYLAHKSLKVANVPLVPEVDPPEEIYQIPKEKCFALVCSAEQLNSIRKERLKALGLNDAAIYASPERIEEEINHFYKVVNKIGCTVIDVTNKAVEETANIILSEYYKTRVE